MPSPSDFWYIPHPDRDRSQWKHLLDSDYSLDTGIIPPHPISHDYLCLSGGGHLTISAGYAWDGASGGIDTPNFARGSCVHDALCQLITLGLLPARYQRHADKLLVHLCRADGMSWIRALWVYSAVRCYQAWSRRGLP